MTLGTYHLGIIYFFWRQPVDSCAQLDKDSQN
jgi:hypothetical protein